MASPGSRHRRYVISRPHGHQRRHIPCPPPTLLARRYSKHLRPARTRILGFDGLCIIFDHFRDVDLAIRRSARRGIHGHHSRVHLTLRGRKLRQRSNSHLSTCLHLLPVDQVDQERLCYVGRPDRSLLRVYGVGLGRIRLHHQPITAACFCPHLHGTIQSETLCQLQHLVCPGDIGQYADTFCRLSPCQE